MNVILFGTGIAAQRCVHYVQERGDTILCFVDNDKAKQGTTIALESVRGGGAEMVKYAIHSPEILQNFEFDKIVIASHMFFREILESLEKLKIPQALIDTSFATWRNLARHTFLADFAKLALKRGLEGNVAECGVYRGEFARVINQCFPNKTFYLMDTFESFAAKDLQNETEQAQKYAHAFSQTSAEYVLSKMPNPAQCVVRKGWFPDTARGLEDERFCFVSLDMDLHDPILAGLEFFYPRMVKGGAILIDDYFSHVFVGAAKAVDDFCDKNHLSFTPIGDSYGVVLLKQ